MENGFRTSCPGEWVLREKPQHHQEPHLAYGLNKPSAYGVIAIILLILPPVSQFKAHKKIGENIRKFRKKSGMTQEKLAEKANLHSVYISQVERADRAPTIETLLKITKALGIRLRDVVGDL